MKNKKQEVIKILRSKESYTAKAMRISDMLNLKHVWSLTSVEVLKLFNMTDDFFTHPDSKCLHNSYLFKAVSEFIIRNYDKNISQTMETE